MSVVRWTAIIWIVVTLLLATPTVQAASAEVMGFKGWSWIGPKNRKWNYRTITRDKGPVRSGTHSERFEIRAGDCGKTGDYSDCRHDREHVGWNEIGSTGLDVPVWYSFSIFLPKESPMSIGDLNIILVEFRPVGSGQINLSVELQKDGLVAVVGSTMVEQEDDMKPPPVALWKAIDRAPDPDRWYDFTLEAIWSRTNAGKIRLYLGEELVASLSGPNTAFKKAVHMQYGIYRSFVSKLKGKIPTQVVYFDNISKASSKESLISH